MSTRNDNAQRRQFGWGELKDGTTWDGIRVTYATKMQYEKTARANGWDAEERPFTVSAFMSWHAAKLAGAHDLGWPEFLEKVIDAGLDDHAPTTDDAPLADDSIGAEVTGESPTHAAPSTPQP